MHFYQIGDNSILLNRLHTAMITVLDIGSIFCLESIDENVQGLHSNRDWVVLGFVTCFL